MIDKINYSKDGFCTANKYQEADCLLFESYKSRVCTYSNICKHQKLGKTCEAPEEEGKK